MSLTYFIIVSLFYLQYKNPVTYPRVLLNGYNKQNLEEDGFGQGNEFRRPS
jgi:hypothetical protein